MTAHMGVMDPKPTAVIVAVDGALLDQSPARGARRRNRAAVPALPAPDSRMLKLIRLERALGHKVFILTSVPERFRTGLHSWLRRLGLDNDGILMRADGEQCPDPQLKTAMAAAVMEDHHVVHAYDDRAENHSAYTRLGLDATPCTPPAHSRVQAHTTTGR